MLKNKFNPINIAIILLVLENWVIFYAHYLGQVSFPYDFSLTYYSVPYFWTTAIQTGIFPEWIGQQALGYPIAYNMQSGLFYPVFWVFPLLKIAYTLHWAVILQCVTVLIGAIGAYFCAISFKLLPLFAFACAFTYQLSGGFYGNAEHPDIIRAYAFVPWLIYAIQLNLNEPKKTNLKTVILIPLFIFLLFVGGYPGASIASVWICGIYILISSLGLGVPTQVKIWGIVKLSSLIFMGIFLSAVQLLPSFMMKQEIARSNVGSALPISWLVFSHLSTTFLGPYCGSFSADVSMRSFYIGVPCIFFLFLYDFKLNYQKKLLVVLLVTALVMASKNPISLFFRLVLAPLGYSRFPISDYKPWILIPLIIICIQSLQEFLQGFGRLKFASLRMIFCSLFIIMGMWLVSAPFTATTLFWKTIILIALTVPCAWFIAKARPSPIYSIGIVLFLSSLHAYFAHNGDSALWRDSSSKSYYKERLNFNFDESNSELKNSFIQASDARPARALLNSKSISWAGYLTGSYEVSDYAGGLQLSRNIAAISNPEMVNFLSLPSTHLLLRQTAYSSQMPLANLKLASLDYNHDRFFSAKMVKFSQNGAVFKVHAEEPATMVENELFYPGWTSSLKNLQPEIPITQLQPNASISASGLRTWSLPKGHYVFTTEYHTPYLKLGAYLSLLGFFFWLLVIIYAYKRRLDLD